MTEDELIREIQLKRQLSELDGKPAPGYDPSDGMETVDELKGYVRFLFATVQEKDQEISHLKNDLSEIKNELKAANRRADEEAETRRKLFERLERFMDDQKSSDEERRRLLRKVETLENRFSRFFVGIIFYLREVLLTLHYEKRLFEHASQPRVAGSDIRLLSHLWSRTNLSRDSYQSG